MTRLYWRLRDLVLLRPVALAIIAIGLVGGIAGFVYWYGPMFVRYPVWQWAFVPDCPLFAILFVLSLGLILVNRSSSFYDALVAFGLIKYGAWTVFVWILYWIYSGGDFTTESIVMSLSHVGLILEGLFLLSFLKMDWKSVIASAAWFGFSDWMDYGPFQTYPHFPMATASVKIVPALSYLDLVQWQTVGMTVLVTALYVVMARRRQRGQVAVAASDVVRGPTAQEGAGM